MEAVRRDRVLSVPLLGFVAMVAGVVGWSVATRHPSPDIEGAIEWLADGDLDRDERARMLLLLQGLAKNAEPLRHRWAGFLAAVARGDQAAASAAERRLGDGAARVLPVEERRWLGLGDALLRNLLAAMSAEAAGGRATATSIWHQVRAQAHMTHRVLVIELADAALERLQ